MMKKRGEQEVKTADTSDKKEKIERQLQAPAFGARQMKLLTDPVLNTYLATMLGQKQQTSQKKQSNAGLPTRNCYAETGRVCVMDVCSLGYLGKLIMKQQQLPLQRKHKKGYNKTQIIQMFLENIGILRTHYFSLRPCKPLVLNNLHQT